MTEDRTPTEGYRKFPVMERPAWRETSQETKDRRWRNRVARREWGAFIGARCERCGEVRFHVSHEMDPEHSAEGPAYHAEFAHHAFEEQE